MFNRDGLSVWLLLLRGERREEDVENTVPVEMKVTGRWEVALDHFSRLPQPFVFNNGNLFTEYDGGIFMFLCLSRRRVMIDYRRPRRRSRAEIRKRQKARRSVLYNISYRC